MSKKFERVKTNLYKFVNDHAFECTILSCIFIAMIGAFICKNSI